MKHMEQGLSEPGAELAESYACIRDLAEDLDWASHNGAFSFDPLTKHAETIKKAQGAK